MKKTLALLCAILLVLPSIASAEGDTAGQPENAVTGQWLLSGITGADGQDYTEEEILTLMGTLDYNLVFYSDGYLVSFVDKEALPGEVTYTARDNSVYARSNETGEEIVFTLDERGETLSVPDGGMTMRFSRVLTGIEGIWRLASALRPDGTPFSDTQIMIALGSMDFAFDFAADGSVYTIIDGALSGDAAYFSVEGSNVYITYRNAEGDSQLVFTLDGAGDALTVSAPGASLILERVAVSK